VEPTEHLTALGRDGEMLAAAAELAGLGAAVPSCPPWRVRDLVRHQGFVHRWAASYVREQRTSPTPEPGEAELLGSGPGDDELLDWYRTGHTELLVTLRAADPATTCWTVVPGPSCVASWARRQAHETAIHRVDAELAGGAATPFPAEFAEDGIDELLTGFFGQDPGRAGTIAAGPGEVLAIRAKDTGQSWYVQLTSDGKDAYAVGRGESTDAPACILAGSASALYLLLWNRAELETAGVAVAGDADVLSAWRENMRVTWE